MAVGVVAVNGKIARCMEQKTAPKRKTRVLAELPSDASAERADGKRVERVGEVLPKRFVVGFRPDFALRQAPHAFRPEIEDKQRSIGDDRAQKNGRCRSKVAIEQKQIQNGVAGSIHAEGKLTRELYRQL